MLLETPKKLIILFDIAFPKLVVFMWLQQVKLKFMKLDTFDPSSHFLISLICIRGPNSVVTISAWLCS